MLITAIVVSLIMMSAATTISNINYSKEEPIVYGHQIDSIRDTAQKIDLAKKENRQQFENRISDIGSFYTETSYNRQKQCYNITLRDDTGAEFGLKCVGNGSEFHDGFEDGEYQDPEWNEEGNVSVERIYSPINNSESIQLETSGSNNQSRATWRRIVDIWNGEWKADGLFYLESFSNSQQSSNTVELYRLNNDTGIELQMGVISDSGDNRSFKIEGDLVNTVNSEEQIYWKEDTWYFWEVIHDGSGEYSARIWRSEDSRPSTPDAVSQGATGTESRRGGFYLETESSNDADVYHDYLRLREY